MSSLSAEPSRRRAAEPPSYTFHLIPHTHWDREWYLPRAEFHARLIPVLDGVLEQLESDPAARFLLDGQTILLEDYLAIRPDEEERVRIQVRRGALEIGPWYILADLLIPSAESLRRNLLEGQRQAERFGRRLDVLYSPDAFGHPAALPRIASEFGLRRAVVRRGLGRSGDFYRWEAPTGETLLVYHLPPGGYDGAMGLAAPGDGLEHAWRRIRHELVERATTRDIAVFLGADHHAMVPGVSALRDRLQALEAGHTVRISGLGEYFDAVERVPPAAPVIRGALRRSAGYTWDLQDVHSARSRLKRRYALAELRLARIAEPLFRRASPGKPASPVLDHAWRTLLQCQFHDTLAGTTCDEAQREQSLRLAAVDALSRTIATSAIISGAGQPGPVLALGNPVDRPREGIVTAELTFFRGDVLVGPPSGERPRSGAGYREFALTTGAGKVVPVQVLAVRPGIERRDRADRYPDLDLVDRVWVAFEGNRLGPGGTEALHPVGGKARPDGPALVRGRNVVANRVVSAEVSGTGSVTLTHQESGTSFPGLLELLAEPDQGDLYTFSPGGRPESGHLAEHGQSVLADGPLVGAIETRWAAGFRCGTVGARLLAIVQRDSPLVRIRLALENRGRDYRLRLRLPIGRGTILAGATLGTDLVPPTPARQPFTLERDVSTAPAHRFVAVAIGSLVVALLAPGFFEYEWIPRGELRVTVWRAVGELSRGELPERPGHAAWPTATPAAQEPGTHTMDLGLAVLPRGTQDLPERLEHLWEEAFLPVQAFFWRE
jgi:mannosylglycerate hydrolase